MAYRNHPTRYLIVKDPAAVAAGRFWAALVSLGKLRPAAPSSSSFFNFLSKRRCASTVSRIPRRRGVSTLARPARQHFFSTPTESLQSAVSRFPVRGVGLSTRPLAARQHIFSILLRGAVALRSVSGFPKSGGALLRPSLRPVNTFFQVRFAFAIRSCPVSRARAGLSTQPTPARQHLFFNLSLGRRESVTSVQREVEIYAPYGLSTGAASFFQAAAILPWIATNSKVLRRSSPLRPPARFAFTLAWTLHGCRARRQGLPRLPRPGWPGGRLRTVFGSAGTGTQPLPGRGRRRWWANPAVTDNKEGGYGSALDWRDGTHIIQ